MPPARPTRLPRRLLERLKPDDLQRTLLIAALIGVGGALATVGFRAVLALLEQALYGDHTGLVDAARRLPAWQRVLYPTLGGALAGFVLALVPRWARPGSSGEYMEAITLGDGVIGTRPSLMRAASSAITVSSGSSIGREASMVQLAALVGAIVGRFRQANRPRRRLLVACGAAAGISAAYNAPLAGALFVAEIILQSFTIESIAPLIVASVISNVTVHRFTGFAPIYHIPTIELQLGLETGAFVALGVIAGLLAPLFLGLLVTVRRRFATLKAPLWAKLALGGLAVGTLSVAEPGVWGNGYSVVDSMLQGGWAWQALLLILVLKVLATSAASGSGAVGGVFTPTLFVGAAIGALFSIGLHATSPAAAPAPAYIAAGMGAFLAACTHAPLMSAMMIFEMTENYDLVAPLMLASVLAFLVKRVLMEKSVYAHALPAPKPAFTALRVRDLMRPDAAGEHRAHEGPPAAEVASALEAALQESDGAYLKPQDTLSAAVDAFADHPGERLPVVDDDRLLGRLSKSDLLLMLHESLE